MSLHHLRSLTAWASAGTWLKAAGASSQARRLSSACSGVDRLATACFAASNSCREVYNRARQRAANW
eukprot:8043654-Alexandrium_andersonii.AAC.1